MRSLLRTVCAVLAVAALIFAPWSVQAETEDTLTLTFYPRVSHEQILGLVIPWGAPETVTVTNYRIADMRGGARGYIKLETASGITRLNFDDVRRIDFVSYPRLHEFGKRMESVIYTVRSNVQLTDGSRIENAILNAHWGTVEGDTELGRFFLSDPMTVASLSFNGH